MSRTYADRPYWQIKMSRRGWTEETVREIGACLDKTHEHQEFLNRQLERDFGIYYDAPCDQYQKIKDGAWDEAFRADHAQQKRVRK